jgi:hypothetical protein
MMGEAGERNLLLVYSPEGGLDSRAAGDQLGFVLLWDLLGKSIESPGTHPPPA